MGELLSPEFLVARQRIEVLTKKWGLLMQMGWMSVKHTFNPNFDDESHFTVATTQTDWEYRASVTDWHLPRVCALADDSLEAVVVHEEVHRLVNPMESLMKDRDSKLAELSVENVARAILAVNASRNE